MSQTTTPTKAKLQSLTIPVLGRPIGPTSLQLAPFTRDPPPLVTYQACLPRPNLTSHTGKLDHRPDPGRRRMLVAALMSTGEHHLPRSTTSEQISTEAQDLGLRRPDMAAVQGGHFPQLLFLLDLEHVVQPLLTMQQSLFRFPTWMTPLVPGRQIWARHVVTEAHMQPNRR